MTSRLTAAADQLRRTIGVTVSVDIAPIDELWSRRFALATGETDPVFFDAAAARAAGFDRLPLPPLLLSATRSWQPGPVADEMAPDGTPLSDVGFPGGHGLRALGGGQELSWRGQPVVGDGLRLDSSVRSVEEKAGRSGDMLVVQMERQFVGIDGEVLLACRENRLLR